MTALGKFFRLSRADRRLLMRTAALAVFIRVWLWIAPFRPLHRLLDRLAAKTRDTSRISTAYPDRAAWAVCAACRRIPGARTCLIEALALEFLLRRHDFPAQLRLGVCKDESGKLRAHAWVELHGRVVIGQADMEKYTLLATLKGSRT